MTLPTPKEFCKEYCTAGLVLTTKSIVEKRDAQIAARLEEIQQLILKWHQHQTLSLKNRPLVSYLAVQRLLDELKKELRGAV